MSEFAIDAGALRARIEIVQRVRAKNTAGYDVTASGKESDEKVVYRCRAQFTRQSGTEAIKAGADFSTVKVRFLIRACPVKLSRLMYVKYNDQYYNISYINEYGDRGKYTEILAELKELGGIANGSE
ncbi:MAG: phage head closure protein [bacterium]|nr:phage head closure protein [bacterium]